MTLITDANGQVDLAATVEAAKEGDTILLPPDRIVVPSGGVVVRKQITLRGSNPGRNRLQCGTRIEVNPGHEGPILEYRNDVGNVSLIDLIIDGKEPATGVPIASYGILYEPQSQVGHFDIRRVDVWRCLVGMRLLRLNNLRIRDSAAKACAGVGLYMYGCAGPHVDGGLYSGNGFAGIHIDHCGGAKVVGTALEANNRNVTSIDPELRIVGE